MLKTTNRFWGRARRGGVGVFIALGLLGGALQPARAQDADNLRELMAYLHRCLKPAGGAVGTEMTIVFSLRRDGSLLGKPRISFAKLTGEAEQQRRFAEGTAAAFDRCLPAPITDALGGAIAGRPLALRFVIQAPSTNI